MSARVSARLCTCPMSNGSHCRTVRSCPAVKILKSLSPTSAASLSPGPPSPVHSATTGPAKRETPVMATRQGTRHAQQPPQARRASRSRPVPAVIRDPHRCHNHATTRRKARPQAPAGRQKYALLADGLGEDRTSVPRLEDRELVVPDDAHRQCLVRQEHEQLLGVALLELPRRRGGLGRRPWRLLLRDRGPQVDGRLPAGDRVAEQTSARDRSQYLHTPRVAALPNPCTVTSA